MSQHSSRETDHSIREMFATEGRRLLVPTYNVLHKQSSSANKPYQELKRKRYQKGKQKAEASAAGPALDSEASSSQSSVINPGGAVEFDRENNFLQDLMRESHPPRLSTNLKADQLRRSWSRSISRRRTRRSRREGKPRRKLQLLAAKRSNAAVASTRRPP